MFTTDRALADGTYARLANAAVANSRLIVMPDLRVPRNAARKISRNRRYTQRRDLARHFDSQRIGTPANMGGCVSPTMRGIRFLARVLGSSRFTSDVGPKKYVVNQ